MKINLYKLSKFFKYIIFLIIAICLIIIVGMLYYLYNNLYRTITCAKEITILQNKVAEETVNLDLLKKIEKKYQEKNNNQKFPNNLKDIFFDTFEKKLTEGSSSNNIITTK